MTEYQEIFRTLPFPSLLLKVDEDKFIVQDVSSKYCDIKAKKPEEFIGKTYPQVISDLPESHRDFRKRLDAIKLALASGEPQKIDCLRQNFKAGDEQEVSEVYWQVENIPLKDSNGKITYILNIARDRTAEILEEREKLKISRELDTHLEKQQHFFEKNPDGLYSLDSEGNFLNLNEGLARLAEISREEMLGMNFLPFCTPHHRELTLNYFQKVLQGEEQDFEAEFITGKNNIIVLRVSMVPMKVDGKISGIYGIAKDITNLRTAEEGLVSMEKTFKALVQEGSDLTCIVKPDGTYRFLSDSNLHILGISPDDFIGKNAIDFIHPDDKERTVKQFALLASGDQVRLDAYRFQDSKGNWRWMESTAINFSEDPHIQGILVYSKEVTELVERKREIKDLIERYRLAVSATEDLVYDWDLQKKEVVRLYKGSLRPFGYSSEEVDKKEFWSNNIHPEEREKVVNQVKEALADPGKDQVKTEYRFKRANGTYANIIDRANIIRNEKGEAIRLIGANSDVSDIVENQKELKAANHRFKFLMQATKEIIWDWDLKKNKIKRSGSYKNFFGSNAPKESSVEDFWYQMIVEKDRERVIESLRKALDNPEVKKWEEEYSFLKKNGSEVHVVDRGYILRDASGTAIRMVGAAMDISETRRMIKEIKKQNQVLQEVAWEQAHIVRAPLARLKGLLNLLEMESYEEWSKEELLKLINDSATELDEVIRNIIKRTEAHEK